MPEPIDDRIFDKIYNVVGRFLTDVGGDPHHEMRRSVDTRVPAFADRLKSRSRTARQG